MRQAFLAILALSLWGGGIAQAAPTQALLEAAILGAEGDSLPQGTRLEFQLPEGTPATIARLIGSEHDLRRAHFVALIETDEGAQLPLRGRVFAVIDVPVPRETLSPGTRLSADDFEYHTLPINAINRFAVIDIDALTGAEVRRILPPGRVVQSQSLQEPRAVQRGQKLDLVYLHGALEVTAPARALADAAAGAEVRVQNLRSNKTVIGIATRDGRVQVSP